MSTNYTQSKMSGAGYSPAMERHLKKIYDCLNIGCNKKAVQEVDRLPKNVRDSTVFRALKSLALIRLCKRRQAFDILNEIDPEDDLDEVTLQTMTSCYKESADVSKIVELYEAAARRRPNDPEIMAHLFMAHVRVFNFRRQKEIAIQMYKNFPKKKRLYSFWAIMSLVMQAQEEGKTSEEGPDRKVCLSLAEKMCEKMIDDERTNEEIELYLIILRKQNKHEEEYKFLTGPICLRITDHLSWFNRRRAYLCLDLKMYSRAFKHYFPTLIQEYPDQIEYYQGLFKSAFLLDTEAPSQQQPVASSDQQVQPANPASGTPVKSTSALAECFDIVEKQCSLTSESIDSTKDQQKGKNQTMSKNLSRTSSLNPSRRRLLRGPFIARAELFHTIMLNQNSLPEIVFTHCKNQFANKFPTVNSLLLDYFQTFSRKIICYYDMDYMIKKFKPSNADKDLLVESIGNWVEKFKQTQTDASAYDLFHITLNYHMLKHSLHIYKTSDGRADRFKLAKQYIDLYDQNRYLGKLANKTEFQPVDNYSLLAIHSIMTNAIDLDSLTSQSILSDSVILSLLVMAENAVLNSPSNHQLKLTLLKLYSFVGASKQCSEVLLSLDIKHFQIDTLGHLLNPVLYNTGNYSLSRESLETCLEFYAHGIRECFEGLTTSYRDGRFSKIEEISGVLRRLTGSLNAAQCVLLKGIVANLGAATPEDLNSAHHSFDPFKELHKIFSRGGNPDSIRDSRDFKVLKSLNAETDNLLQLRQIETMRDEKLWLELRYFLLRSAYLQQQLYNGYCDNLTRHEIEMHYYEIGQCSRCLERLMKELEAAEVDSPDRRFSFLEPEAAPFRWKYIDHRILLSLTNELATIVPLGQHIQEEYISHLDTIINNLETKLTSISSFVEMKQALSSLTISIEFISLCATSLISISTSNSVVALKNSTGMVGKASPSPQQQSHPIKLKSIAHQMINKTEAQLTRLSGLIKNIDPKTLILDKVTSLEKSLLSDVSQTRLDTKFGSILVPLMGTEVSVPCRFLAEGPNVRCSLLKMLLFSDF